MSTVIEINNISKQYRLGLIGSRTIASDFHRFLAKLMGKEDPTLKIGTENKLNTVDSEYVWALKNISYSIEQGEVLGIIGKNGAGKSTLLKILSKVTTPTLGNIKIKGRIASLLEVGTGFNPELSGRENIFLNGAILGMTKSEISRKLDEIVDFSGVEKYIDTPVKRYSSGMYVRLAFAVAAHLEPDILIVDEVLAVGDAEFQKKALGKMNSISKAQGRTVLFVSHNMGAVNSLCTKALLLERGTIKSTGAPNFITNMYLKGSSETINYLSLDLNNNDNLTTVKDNIANILSIKIKDYKGKIFEFITVRDSLYIEIEYEIFREGYKPIPQVNLISMNGETVFIGNCHIKTDFTKGKYKAMMQIPADFLNAGGYYFQFNLATMNPYKDHYRTEGMLINVVEDLDSPTKAGYTGGDIPGVIRPFFEWKNEKIY